MDSASRKLHSERIKKAKEYSEKVKESEESMNKLKEAKQFISEHYGENAEVIHKVWKRGKIESISDGIATIFFPYTNLIPRKSLALRRNSITSASEADSDNPYF